MYTSSDGTLKDVKTLDSAYLVNAISKAYREIWNSTSNVQYCTYLRNINILSQELEKRFIQFEIEKFGGKN